MRKVFLGDLPRGGEHNSKSRVNWRDSIGFKVKFIYDEIYGEVKILDYDKLKQTLTIEYLNFDPYKVRTSQFQRCKIGGVIGLKSSRHKYNVGDIVIDVKFGKLQIVERNRIGLRFEKNYKYKCIICGNIDNILERNLNIKTGCNRCCYQPIIHIGVNDIWTTAPSLGRLLWNSEDGFLHTSNSSKRLDFKCPNCQEKIENKQINNVKNNGLSCPKCSDGISYPNKILYNTLKQANIRFHPEYSSEWTIETGHENEKMNGRKLYDAYIPSLNCVVEMHGGQHYKERKDLQRSLDEEKENDKIKQKLATAQKVYYIAIKSDISEFDYIKSNILSSDLIKLIDFSTVDWHKVEEDSQISLVKIVCDLWNEKTNNSIQKIENQININKCTIRKYLKRGKKLGWCDYDAHKESTKGQYKKGEISKSKKSIIMLSLDGQFRKEFESITDASIDVKISISNISSVCRKKRYSSGGYRWMFKEDYEKYISQAN